MSPPACPGWFALPSAYAMGSRAGWAVPEDPHQPAVRHHTAFILFLETSRFAVNFPQSTNAISPLFFTERSSVHSYEPVSQRGEPCPCLLSLAKGCRGVWMPCAGSQLPSCANSEAVLKSRCSQGRNGAPISNTTARREQQHKAKKEGDFALRGCERYRVSGCRQSRVSPALLT